MHDREKVIKGIESCEPSISKRVCNNCPYREEMNCDYVLWHDALTLLKEQESVIESLKSDLHETLEVVSGRLNVVRCKDCKWSFKTKDGFSLCNKGITFDRYVGLDWFCADGKRQEGK